VLAPPGNLDNLTRQKHLQSLRYGQNSYGCPRNVTASVRWKF